MYIYIMRHGETEWNKLRKLQGQTDIPLNEFGEELAYITRDGMKDLEFQAVYSSPLIRARRTAEIMAEGRSLPVIVNEYLKEINFGAGEGESLEAINQNPDGNLYKFLNKPEEYTPMEGGESFEQVKDRCRKFMEEVIIPSEGKCDRMLIVAHGAFIRIMISLIENIPYSEFWKRSRHKNCAVTTFSCENGKLHLLEEGKIYYTEKEEATW